MSPGSEGTPVPRGDGTPLRAAPKFCCQSGGADLKAAPAATFCESEGRAGFLVQASRSSSACNAAAPSFPEKHVQGPPCSPKTPLGFGLGPGKVNQGFPSRAGGFA